MQINLNNVVKSFGSDHLFTVDSLLITDKDKVGIVGRNGIGKTTLLNILMGIDDDYTGNISGIQRDKLGFLTQDLALDLENNIYDEVMLGAKKFTDKEKEIEETSALLYTEKSEKKLNELNIKYHDLMTEFENMGGYKYKSMSIGIIKGLGYSEQDFNKIIGTLSGGQKMRVALAKLLVSSPEVLVLDEPTNYLDTQSISWLESFLASFNSSVIVVSHDRYFLDRFTNKIVEIENKSVYSYTGNYSDYVAKKKQRVLTEERAYEKQQREIKKQEKVINTLKQFNREKSIKRARSREKALEKIELVNKYEYAKISNIRFKYNPMVSKRAISVLGLDFGYTKDRMLFKDFSIDISSNDRLGIVGNNATGKSTFLKLLTGILSPQNGIIRTNPKCTFQYFKQEHDDLNDNLTILDQMREATGEDDGKIRTILGAMLFSGDDVHKVIGTLSGGEKSRVAIAILMMHDSNVLILDEPTNHLDIETKEILEDALNQYEGIIISVSHDRYYLNKICNRIMYLSDDEIHVFNGNYEYAMGELNKLSEVENTNKKEKQEEKTQSKSTLSNNKRIAYENELETIEEDMDALENEKSQIEKDMSNEEFFSDSKNVQKSANRLHEIELLLEEKESKWLEITEILENN